MSILSSFVAAWPMWPFGSYQQTQLAQTVRDKLMLGASGYYATKVASEIDYAIGRSHRHATVSIPFRTCTGQVVTLFGGWIHATHYVSWDVLDDTSPTGDYDGGVVQHVFPAGLSCLKTVDLVRALRSL